MDMEDPQNPEGDEKSTKGDGNKWTPGGYFLRVKHVSIISISQSIYPFIYPSVHSRYPSIYPFIHSIYPSQLSITANLSIYPSIPATYLNIYAVLGGSSQLVSG